METMIRKVQQGDANALAYIQTESWKAAFAGILDAEMLAKCTDIDRATDKSQAVCSYFLADFLFAVNA